MKRIPFLLLLLVSLSLAAGASQLPPGFVEQLVAQNLDPADMVMAPDGRIFITIKSGKVTIVENGDDTGSILEVSDNGKGIPENQQKKIFDVFYRGTEDSIGLGMGLFLAKSLTEKMGGSISCSSVENKTTSMLITFNNQ